MGGVWAAWVVVAALSVPPTLPQVLVDLDAVADAVEARALREDIPIAEALNAFLSQTPKSEQDGGVPEGETLSPFLPPRPDVVQDAPVTIIRHTLPRAPPGKGQVTPPGAGQVTPPGAGQVTPPGAGQVTLVVRTQFGLSPGDGDTSQGVSKQFASPGGEPEVEHNGAPAVDTQGIVGTPSSFPHETPEVSLDASSFPDTLPPQVTPGTLTANPVAVVSSSTTTTTIVSQETPRVAEEGEDGVSGSVDEWPGNPAAEDVSHPRVLRPTVSALEMMVKMAEQRNKSGESQDHASDQSPHDFPDRTQGDIRDPLPDHTRHQATDRTQDHSSNHTQDHFPDHTRDHTPEEESTQRVNTLNYYYDDDVDGDDYDWDQQEDVFYRPESVRDVEDTADSSHGIRFVSPLPGPHDPPTRQYPVRAQQPQQNAQQPLGPEHPYSLRYLTAQQFLQHAHSQQYPQHTSLQQYLQHISSQQYPQHASSQQYPQHASSQQYQQHAPSQRYPQQSSSQQYPQHASSQQYPQHASSQQYQQHASSQRYPQQSSSQQYPQHTSSQQYPQHASLQQHPQHTTAHQLPETQLYWQEAKRQLAERLEQHLYQLTQNPQAQQIVQQLLQRNPQAQTLMEEMLENQVSESGLVHLLQQHHQQQQLQEQQQQQQEEQQQQQQQQQPHQPQQEQQQQQQGVPQGQQTSPLFQTPGSDGHSSEVDTFNIVITKNLTGGQSQPSVQFLSDAKVDSMLLNTSITSVTDIQALKRVVESAVNQAVTSRPVAIQEAIAQVVESPGHEPTVNVVNSTIPNMEELEVTINKLLGSHVVYDDPHESHSAVGRIPHPDGSVVNRLLNNTIGVGNLNINSTSKTNVVNIFIINIIGGVRGDEDVAPRPVSPGHVSNLGPTFPSSASGEPPLGSTPVNLVTTDISDVDSEMLSSLFSSGASPSPAGQSSGAGQLPLKPPNVVPPLIPLPPGIPTSGSIPSSFAPHPELSGPPALPPVASSPPSKSHFELKGPPVPPPAVPLPSTQVPQHLAGLNTGAHPANPDGIILNNNQVLNLLPEFIRATTIPPVVPLYNTSVHEILGKKPSVLGLLPNKVFEIIKPHVEPSSNNSYGGIFRKTMVGNLTSYFPTGSPPVLTRDDMGSKTNIATPPSVQYQYPPHTPNIPPTDPVPSNPYPFHKELPPEYFNMEYSVVQRSPVFFPKGDIFTSFSPSPALGSARSPNPHQGPVPHQSPMQQFNIVNEDQPQRQGEINLLTFTGNNNPVEDGTSNVLNSFSIRTGQHKTPQEPAQQESTNKQKEDGKKKSKKGKKKTSGIREIAADAMAAAESRMDNFMKAVAIGALPSSIAFATALWPYWAPFVLGKRRRRSLSDVVEAAPRGTITQDWLSILTGMKYKDAGTDFPSAWDRRKNSPIKKQNSSPKPSSAPSSAGAERQKSEALPGTQKPTVESGTSSSSVDTKESTVTKQSVDSASTEESKLMDPVTIQGVKEVSENANERIKNNSQEAAVRPGGLTEPATDATKMTTVTKTSSDTSEATESTISTPDGSMSPSVDDMRPEDVIRTTEKATTVKRSTPAGVAATTAKDKLDDSIAQVMSSLVSDNVEPNVIYPRPVDIMGDSGTTTEENKDKDSPKDVALVTNFLYSALNGWKNGESPLVSDKTPPGPKEDLPPAVTGIIDLKLSTDFPGQILNVTDSPIFFINAAPAVINRITASTLPPSTAGPRPPPYPQQQASQSTTLADTTLGTSSALPSSTTLLSRFPNRRRSTTTSKPTMFIANQAVTHTEDKTDPGSSDGAADVITETTPVLQALTHVRIPIRPEWVTRQTTTSKPSTLTATNTIITKSPNTTTKETTTLSTTITTNSPTSTPHRRTATPPATTTTTTTPTTTTTTPTTTTPTTTTTTTTTTPTTTTTTTTTTPTTTTTTTTPSPSIFTAISSAIGTSNDQLQNAIGFVGSVAVYGAAALMPLWLPIVLGKRRRRRDVQEEEEEDGLQEILEAVRMIYSPPSVVQQPSQEDIESSDKSRKTFRFPASNSKEEEEEGSDLFLQSHNLKRLTRYIKELQNRMLNK